MQFNIFLCTALLLISSLVACKTVDVTGNKLKQSDIDYIKNNRFMQSQVLERLGTPTIIADYSPNIWYYIYVKTTKNALTLPTIIEQNIFKITFDQNGKTSFAEVLTDNHNNNVDIISKITPTPNNEQSSIQEFIKNIGKFNKSKKKK